MGESLQIRPAEPADRDHIVAFCQNTFDWGDYIEHAWDQWINDPSGKLLVGLVDGRPVAMMHVAILEEGQAWMEGMRVHPDFRRHGLGTAIDAAGRAYARERGCRVARLATYSANVTAQKTLDAQGYLFVTRFNNWKADPVSADSLSARVAEPPEVSAIFARWQVSEARLAGLELLPDRHWHWARLSEERLREQVDLQFVRTLANAVAIFPVWAPENEFGFFALFGDEDSMPGLAGAARAEAGYRGFKMVEAIIADHPVLNTIMGNAGYSTEGGMLIYEQAL